MPKEGTFSVFGIRNRILPNSSFINGAKRRIEVLGRNKDGIRRGEIQMWAGSNLPTSSASLHRKM